jgi:hypothetical protein
MNFLAVFLATSFPINLNFPQIDLPLVLVRVVALIPLIGGYLLAREGRGNWLLEAGAVLLLVLATVVPPILTQENLPGILNSFINRLPIAVFLLGLALVRDGGFKMIVGLVLMIVSGLVFLPSVTP